MTHYAKCPECKTLYHVEDRRMIWCPCTMQPKLSAVNVQESPSLNVDLPPATRCLTVSVL